ISRGPHCWPNPESAQQVGSRPFGALEPSDALHHAVFFAPGTTRGVVLDVTRRVASHRAAAGPQAMSMSFGVTSVTHGVYFTFSPVMAGRQCLSRFDDLTGRCPSAKTALRAPSPRRAL